MKIEWSKVAGYLVGIAILAFIAYIIYNQTKKTETKTTTLTQPSGYSTYTPATKGYLPEYKPWTD
jgi:hypothetical protein